MNQKYNLDHYIGKRFRMYRQIGRIIRYRSKTRFAFRQTAFFFRWHENVRYAFGNKSRYRDIFSDAIVKPWHNPSPLLSTITRNLRKNHKSRQISASKVRYHPPSSDLYFRQIGLIVMG